MSVASEITRLREARNLIRLKLVSLGLAGSGDKLDALAAAVEGIADRGAVTAQVMEGESYTIPAGYHDGAGTVTGVAGGGSYSLQSKSVTPGAAQQLVTPDAGSYGLSSVTVEAIPARYGDTTGDDGTAAHVALGRLVHTSVNGVAAQITGTMPSGDEVSY